MAVACYKAFSRPSNGDSEGNHENHEKGRDSNRVLPDCKSRALPLHRTV